MSEQNQAMGWDDVLENDDTDFTVLKEGDYDFEIVDFQRGSFPGSEKMCACDKATITLRIESDQGTANVFDDLILHKRMEWKLSQFFRCIGQKKKGERVVMNWNRVVGSKGRAHIIVNKFTDKNGQNRENNKVGKYLEYNGESLPSGDDFMKIPEGTDAELPF